MSNMGPTSSNWFLDAWNTLSEYIFSPIYENVVQPIFGVPQSPQFLAIAPPLTQTTSLLTPAAPSTTLTSVPSLSSSMFTSTTICAQDQIRVSGHCIAEKMPPSSLVASYSAPSVNPTSTGNLTAFSDFLSDAGTCIANGTTYAVSGTLKSAASLAEFSPLTGVLAELMKNTAQLAEDNPVITTLITAGIVVSTVGCIAYNKGYLPGFRKNQLSPNDAQTEAPIAELLGDNNEKGIPTISIN